MGSSTLRVDLIATAHPKGCAIRPLVEFHLTALESIRNSPSKGRRDASRPQYGRGRPGACRSETGPCPRVLLIVTQCLTLGQCLRTACLSCEYCRLEFRQKPDATVFAPIRLHSRITGRHAFPQTTRAGPACKDANDYPDRVRSDRPRVLSFPSGRCVRFDIPTIAGIGESWRLRIGRLGKRVPSGSIRCID